jgi:signal transduction histidine kinase
MLSAPVATTDVEDVTLVEDPLEPPPVVIGPPVPVERRRRVVFSKRPWASALFLLSSFPIGLFWFVVLVVLVTLTGVLLITFLGATLLAVTILICGTGARVERWRVAKFLGTSIRDPYRPLPEGPRSSRVRIQIGDSAVWRDLVYLLVLFPLGLIEFLIGLGLLIVTVGLLFLPIRYTARALTRVGQTHARFATWLLGTNRQLELEQRVTVLTESRSRVIEAVAEERRRIERDLHDGAQQRLVALAMDLGMAKEKIDKDPAAASALVAEAHDQAKRAIVELRDLVRGLHPAVLTDRGLDAAISALAGRSPVPVSVEVDSPERLSDAIETNAYFVVAEALTNVAKHSRATQARVIVRREGDLLVIEIADNGVGGADPAHGTGLSGLRDRVGAFDGTLRVSSPEGGPTWIRAEIPCGS